MSKTLTLAVWGRSRCRGRPQPRRRCWEPASGTQRGFPSVGSAWLAGATRVYTPRLPNAMSERISGEDWGPLPPPNARTRRGAVTCRTRAGARRSLRVRQRSPNRACRQSFEAPEERARRRAQNAAARRAGLGNAGKGALLKTGGAGCGEEPTSGSGRRGHRALDVSARPQATDEPRCPQARRDPTVPSVPPSRPKGAAPLRTPRLRPRPRETHRPSPLPFPPAPQSPGAGREGRALTLPGPSRFRGGAHSPSAWCRDGAGRALRRGREATGRERRSTSQEGRAAPTRTRVRRGWRAGGPAGRGGAGRWLPGGWVLGSAPSRVPSSGTSRSRGLPPRSRRPHLPRGAAPFSFSRSRLTRRGAGPRGHLSTGRRLELNVGTLRAPSLRSKRDWWRTEVRVLPTLKVLLYCSLDGRMPASVPSPL